MLDLFTKSLDPHSRTGWQLYLYGQMRTTEAAQSFGTVHNDKPSIDAQGIPAKDAFCAT